MNLEMAVAGLSVLVMGHVLYGLPRHDRGRTVVSLHNGDDFRPGDEAPRPERLVGVHATGAEGLLPLQVSGEPASGVFVDVSHVEAASWLVAETIPTFIELEADAFTRYLTHEGLDHVIARRKTAAPVPGREIYSKHIKVAIPGSVRPGSVWPAAARLPVELQPETPLELGTPLLVRLWVDGAHAAGRQVRVHHKAATADAPREVLCAATDSDGAVRVVIDQPGYWRLHAVEMAAHDGAGADWRSRWACLVFEA